MGAGACRLGKACQGSVKVPVWKPAAIADRKRISQYIARDNPMAAIEITDLLMARALMLDDHPLMGRVGRVKGTRELVAHPNYLLFYRVVNATVEILRVKHAAQQVP